MRYIAARSAFLFFAVVATDAHAFFDRPWITPENPIAGENVSVNIHGGICDAIFSWDGYPQLTSEGSAIRLLEYGRHYEPGSELCTDSVGTVTRSIGAYAPGDYVLRVDLIYPDPEFGSAILNIGVVSFAVRAPPPPVPLPASTIHGLICLFLLLISASFLSIRKKDSDGVEHL
jgi:hypothetical protein